MPLNLGVGHTFLKTIVYLGVLEIGYSSEGNTGADSESASPVLERLGTQGGESHPLGWGLQQRRDGRWPIRRRGRAGLPLRGASSGKLGGSVAGLERGGGGGGTAGSQRPRGHGPDALPALGYSQLPARGRLEPTTYSAGQKALHPCPAQPSSWKDPGSGLVRISFSAPNFELVQRLQKADEAPGRKSSACC